MQHFRYDQRHLNKKPLHSKIFYYALAIIILVALSSYLATGFRSFYPTHFLEVFNRITLSKLLLYSFYTFARLVLAYFIGLLLTIILLFILTRHRKLENALMPIFDILQSVPILAFFPLIIVAFATLRLPEIAAQIVLILATFWPVLFGAIGGYHQIPQDILDAAQIYGASRTKMFSRVVLPAIFPSLITGTIIGFGAGWNVIIISEYINYGAISIRLPGLGNLLSSSAGNDNGIFTAALVCLVLMIFIVDRFVWRKLIVYSEKFKFE